MKLVIQITILLVCGVVCNSAILRCQCLKTYKMVAVSDILKVDVFPPRPYCSKQEIIVTLKKNTRVCLDPNEEFAIAVVKSSNVKSQRQTKVRTMKSTTTTTAATAMPTVTRNQGRNPDAGTTKNQDVKEGF